MAVETLAKVTPEVQWSMIKYFMELCHLVTIALNPVYLQCIVKYQRLWTGLRGTLNKTCEVGWDEKGAILSM